MDLKTVFCKTAKGLRVLGKKDRELTETMQRVLQHVDGKTNVGALAEMLERMPLSDIQQVLNELLAAEFVRAIEPDTVHSVFASGSSDEMDVAEVSIEEFLAIQAEISALQQKGETQKRDTEPPPQATAQERRESQQKAEEAGRQARLEAEARARAENEARIRRELEAQKRAEAEAQAKAEAERLFREEAERKRQAEREALIRAEAAAQALAKAEAERRAREEAEARAKAEAAERARKEAEEKARAEAEAKRKAQEEAERKAREEAAARAKAEERAKQAAEEKARAEAQARAEAERKAKEEAERKAREAAAARAKAEAEEQARREAEEAARAEAEAEAQRIAREAAIARATAEAERRIQEEMERKRRAEAEAQAKAEAQRKAQEEAERKAREEAEARAQAEAEERARREAEEKARAEAEAQAKAEAQRKAQEEAERKAREEAEARAQAEAEERARREAEEQARAEAEAQAKAEAQRKAQEDAERKAREEAEAIAQAEAEERARREAEEKARAEAEETARREEEEKAQAETGRKARELAEIERKAREVALHKAKKEAEARARDEVLRKKQEKAELKAREKAEKAVRKRAEAQAREQVRLAQGGSPRRALPRGTRVLAVLLMLLALPALLLYLLGLPFLVEPVEKLASARIHEPVHVSFVRAGFWPSPHLRLSGVTVGESGDVKINELRVKPALSSLFGETKVLTSVEAEGLSMNQDALARIPGWVEVRGGEKIQVGKIFLKDAQLDVKGIDMPHLDAEATLSPDGLLEKARVGSTDGKITVNASPQGGGEFNLVIAAKDWQPPLWPGLTVDELNATATAGRDGMRISRMEGTVYGGTISGTATVNWSHGWNADGELETGNLGLSGLMQALSAGEKGVALTGRLDAKMAYSLKSESLAGLMTNARIQGNFTCRDGGLINIDLARAFRTRDREKIMGGKTHFRRLTGTLSADANRYQFRQLKLSSSQVDATGDAEVAPDGRLSGVVNVDVAITANPLRSRASLGGSVLQPELK